MSATDVQDTALHAATTRAGIADHDARLLHQHASVVYLLPTAGVVARVSRGLTDRRRARTALTVARWLTRQGFPATAPIDVDQPVEVAGLSVTFWRYYPQAGRQPPPARELGVILRELHQLPAPPVHLARHQPLATLGAVLASSTSLSDADRSWLIHRRTELLAQYQHLESDLGEGFIHADAYPGNLLWNANRAVLGDWDEVALGPREVDLVNTYQGTRLGRSASELADFASAYGWDVTGWSGFPLLKHIRDLHTLAAYIIRADAADSTAAQELRHRIRTLRTNDLHTRWQTR